MDDESGHPRQKTTEGERAHTHCTLMALSVFRVVSGRYYNRAEKKRLTSTILRSSATLLRYDKTKQ